MDTSDPLWAIGYIRRECALLRSQHESIRESAVKMIEMICDEQIVKQRQVESRKEFVSKE